MLTPKLCSNVSEDWAENTENWRHVCKAGAGLSLKMGYLDMFYDYGLCLEKDMLTTKFQSSVSRLKKIWISDTGTFSWHYCPSCDYLWSCETHSEARKLLDPMRVVLLLDFHL